MKRRIVLLAALLAAPLVPQTTTPAPEKASLDGQAFVARYCTSCHNAKAVTAGLDLNKINFSTVGGQGEILEKIIQKVRSAAMPPAGLPHPDTDARNVFVASLASSLDTEAAAHPNPGRAVVHRLNRTEYTNAIRDLFGIEMDGQDLLPADDSGYGFDNIADVLSVSPALLDRYMSAAGKISRLAAGDPTIRPSIRLYSVRRELIQNDRMSERLPFGSRGGLSVRHYFPVDGEYLLKLRLQRTANNSIMGLGTPNQLELRLDRRRLKTFTVGGDGPINPWQVVPNPSLYEQTADDGLEIRVQVKAGTREVGATFLTTRGAAEGPVDPRLSTSSFEFAEYREAEMSLGSIEIHGPFPAKVDGEKTRYPIFVCEPGQGIAEEACAERILSNVAHRAFRRPVSSGDVRTLMSFYKTGRAKGSFEAGIELAIREVLIDPDFLFRVERNQPGSTPGAVVRVSDLEVASRLSFFLWSTIPDDELLNLAAANKLREPAVLDREVKRMLADDRAISLVSNFAGQWLFVRNVAGVIPDPDGFPEFDENLREAFHKETELFIESQLHSDRSVVDLLTANYTFVNERLAKHYGIPNIYGNTFRRVTLDDPNRFGLLGQGSVLTVTSYGHRTSPTLRGKWIMQNLLGAPPPPPPPNVPALEDSGSSSKVLSVRELMEEHRKNAVCASCHARMDQYGFALENFDAIGKWRSTDQAQLPVDASATLPDGTKFKGVTGLRALLLDNKEQVAGAVAERLMTYALGRGVESYDQPALRKILHDSAPGDYRWSDLISGIIRSVPFQMRKVQ